MGYYRGPVGAAWDLGAVLGYALAFIAFRLGDIIVLSCAYLMAVAAARLFMWTMPAMAALTGTPMLLPIAFLVIWQGAVLLHPGNKEVRGVVSLWSFGPTAIVIFLLMFSVEVEYIRDMNNMTAPPPGPQLSK